MNLQHVIARRFEPTFQSWDWRDAALYALGLGIGDNPLEIPAGAVVVQGSRAVTNGFGKDNGLSIYAPIIVKYRDDKTDASTKLEDYLR